MRILMILLMVGTFFSITMAQDKKFQLTQVTYVGITKAQKLLDEGKTDDAKLVLLDLRDSSKIRKKLDRAYVRFYLGYFYTLVNDANNALKYFKEALTYEALAPAQISNTYLNIIQITMELEKYNESLHYIDELILVAQKPKSQYLVTKANIEMILKRYKKVIRDIDKAIKIDKKAKPAWLKMKYYSYYMLNDYMSAIGVLKLLIALEPTNKEYWLQLSSLYSVSNNFNASMSSLDIANIAKLDLNEAELLRLISWLQYSDIPYKAAKMMEEKIKTKSIATNEKNLNAIGDLYYEAREYKMAIKWYKKSASLSKSSIIYFKIAKIYANERKYEDVVENIKLSLAFKDNKKADGSKYLLLGKAYYELSNTIEAKKSFYRAQHFQKSKKIADAWLNYL